MAEQNNKNIANRNLPGFGRRMRYAQIEHPQNTGEAFKRIAVYFIYEKKMVFGMLAVVIFGTICGIYAPSLQSKAVDIIAGSLSGNLFRAIVLMMTVYLLYSASQLVQNLLCAKLSQRIVKRMREELFGKIVDLPIRYLDTHSHGDVMSRMTNDIENISTTVSQSLPSLFSGVLTVIGTAAIMIWYCWQLALLSCITMILTLIVTKTLSKNVRKYSRHRQELLGMINGTVKEMVSGYRTVVAYNHQDITVDEFCQTSDSLTRAGIITETLGGMMGPVMNCVSNFGYVIIAVFGGYFSIRGMISVGLISAFLVYAKQFSRPLNEIAQVYGQLQTALAGAERVFAVLDEASEKKQGKGLEEEAQAEVCFQNVTFSYVPGQPVLHDFTLTVPSGKKVALVGATGSGKTTVLFSDTVRNNLKYANENVTEEQLEKALEMSCCKELIQMLPQGLDTVLTGAGETISQGQRQLLAIARAFVADPKILILDEATSNVDTRTEKAIQDAMQLVMKNRTSIVIAHRLSTIRDADIIVVLDHGRIAESGRHEELLARKGKYYDLYMIQYAGFAT